MATPENANDGCVGPSSETAGRASGCKGCPNQGMCSSGAFAGPDPDVQRVKDRLENVKHKLLILSGKGGVGKSTVSAQLAFSLAQKGHRVGLVDIDVCGPSIPKIVGLEHEQVFQSAEGWSPVFVNENLGVMSIGFLLNDPHQAVIWKGPKKNGMIKQFLRDVDWGDLEYLIVDTPPGTSDEHMSIAQYLVDSGIDGAIVVTTPQEVALMDVRKELNFCKKVKIPILGVVENMKGFVCPKCDGKSEIFKGTTGGAEHMAKEFEVPYLGGIPLDPKLTRCCDEGKGFLEAFPESPAAVSMFEVVAEVEKLLL